MIVKEQVEKIKIILIANNVHNAETLFPRKITAMQYKSMVFIVVLR